MKFKEFIKKNYLYLIILFILGLTPLLWFQPGLLITGTDVDFPIFPNERLEERSYVWYPGVLGGSDRSNNTASLVVVGLQAGLDYLNLDIITIEKLTYIFWFLLTGLAMYFLMYIIYGYSSIQTRIANFSATVIYMFNFYLAFIWLRLQIDTVALILFPVYLGCLIGVSRKIISLPVSLFIISSATIICGAIGIQPPLILIFFSMLFLYVIYYSVSQFFQKQWKNIIRLFAVFILFTIIFFLASSYWAIPEINFIFSSNFNATSIGKEVYAVDTLVEWSSRITSFLNIFRFFGDIAWFDSWDGELYNPDFQIYLSNPILSLASFILPLIVFSIFLFSKKIKDKIFFYFAFLTLIGLFFSKGSHPPFGNIYLWMINNVPLFWIQRAPWQKFTILTLIGYSVLGGIGLGYIYKYSYNWTKKFKNKFILYINKYLKYVFIFIVVVFTLSYNYYFVLGQMFSDKEGEVGYHEKFDLGFHHKFPDYLFQAKEWIDSQDDYFKIALLPDDRVAVYDWGYGGSATAESLLFNKGLISRQYGEGFAPPHSVENLNNLFTSLLYDEKLGTDVSKILNLMGVKYILQRNDFRYDFFGDKDSPEFIKEMISKQNDIKLEKTFGKWDFYKVENTEPLIYVPKNIIRSINSDINLLITMLKSETFNNVEQPVILFDNEPILDTDKFNLLSRTQTLNIDSNFEIPVIDGTIGKFNWISDEIINNETLIVKASFHKGKKTIISDNGQGDTDSFIFPTPKNVPYSLKDGKTKVEAIDPTLIYIKTSERPIIITNISANNKDLKNDIKNIWLENKVIGEEDGIEKYPIFIPPNKRAIIQINGEIKEDIIFNFFYKKIKQFNIPILNNNEYQFDWNSDEVKNNKNILTKTIHYEGSKRVISDNGQGDNDMFIFNSPEEVPYKLLNNATNWSAFDSTLIYLKTSNERLMLNEIFTDNKEAIPIAGIWWETGSVGAGVDKAINFPLMIPENQKAIIQINKKLSDENIKINYTIYKADTQANKTLKLPVMHKKLEVFDWNSDEVKNNENIITKVIYYEGSKGVISDNGKGDSDMLIFNSPEEVPYKLLNNSTSWSAYNSTLLYLKTTDQPLILSKIYADMFLPLVGIWWDTDSVGAGGYTITIPFELPEKQKVIIQINDKVEGNIYLNTVPNKIDYEFKNNSEVAVPKIKFTRINPTKYKVKIYDAKEPFLLVIKENFNINWKAYLNSGGNIEKNKFDNHVWETWFKKPLDEEIHIIANGYANSWWINLEKNCKNNDSCVKNPDGSYYFELIIEFWPQRLFYLGLFISGLTLIFCFGYFAYAYSKNKKVKKS